MNGQEGVPPVVRQIEDFDSWLLSNALGAAPSGPDVRREEERARVEQFSEYQAAVHRTIFSNHEEEQERLRLQERQKRLEAWNDTSITVYVQNGLQVAIRDVPLRPLADSCETIYALASTWHQYSSSNERKRNEDDDDDEFHISLQDFSESSVRAFLALVQENSTQTTVEDDAPEKSNNTSAMNDLSGESIIDCCRIASYLQNASILNETEAILLESIDNDNCLSIAQLADQLGLPCLFEAAVRHVIKSLMGMESNAETWDYLETELQERILAIKAAFESSVQTNKSTLYFGSLTEYISIFAERVQYNRERLAEAKEQHETMMSGTRSWLDTGEKIARQEQRVRTLEKVLAEQKRLFAGKGLLPQRQE